MGRGRRAIVALTWFGGATGLVVTMFGYLVNDQPYPATWAWLCFIGMCAMEDILFGPEEGSTQVGLPRMSLLATCIMFRRHPEITMIVVLAAAPMSSLVKRQDWVTQATNVALWLFTSAFGIGAFRLVGFEDGLHFVLATIVLVLVFALVEYTLATDRLQLVMTGCFYVAGILLALAWRTGFSQRYALICGELALLGVCGVVAGWAAGGRVSWFRRWYYGTALRQFLRTRALVVGSSVIALGGCCNLAVVLANGGRMPVDIAGLPVDQRMDLASLSSVSSTHALLDSSTRLPMLADRFTAYPFPGIASPGDVLMAVGFILMAALAMQRPRSARKDVALEEAA